MATVTHDHIPGAEVYIVTTCEKNQPTVLQAKVIKVTVEVLTTTTTVTYIVSTSASNSDEIDAANVFALKADALIEFSNRVG